MKTNITLKRSSHLTSPKHRAAGPICTPTLPALRNSDSLKVVWTPTLLAKLTICSLRMNSNMKENQPLKPNNNRKCTKISSILIGNPAQLCDRSHSTKQQTKAPFNSDNIQQPKQVNRKSSCELRYGLNNQSRHTPTTSNQNK